MQVSCLIFLFSIIVVYVELLPMTSYFSDIVKDLKDRTEIATNALMDSEETAEVSFDSTLADKANTCFG